MTKRFKNFILKLTLVLVALLCVQGFVSTDAQAADIQIVVDNKTISTDVPPTIIGGRTMVPVRAVGEAVGAQVEWDGAARSITAVKGANTVVMVADQYSYTLNGTGHSMDAAVTIIDGRAMVPLRALGEALGCGIEWDNNTVYVYSNGNIYVVVNDFGSSEFYLNLRQGPGTNYAIVGRVNSGDVLQVITETSGWYKIKTSNGADAYLSKEYVSIYSGGGDIPNPPTPPDSGDGGGSTTGDTNGTLTVTKRDTSVQGQASIAFNIGSGTPSVISNDGTKVVLQVSGAQIDSGVWQPAENLSPFNGFKVENYGANAVRMTASVTTNGYFRLDINGSTFTVTAVAKHKNGTTGLAGKTIVVSPGHGVYSNGAIDRGAVSPINGLDEVDFNTPLSLKLRDKLEAAGATVIMIRDTEGPIDMSLWDRSVIANNANADAFVEIHGDSAANSSAKGIGTWIYTDNTRLTTAAQVDMRNEFGYVMNQALADTTGQPAYVKYGNFSVIRETEVPCVLVECGFLTNPEDAARLATDWYQESLAQGIFNGLANYFAY